MAKREGQKNETNKNNPIFGTYPPPDTIQDLPRVSRHQINYNHHYPQNAMKIPADMWRHPRGPKNSLIFVFIWSRVLRVSALPNPNPNPPYFSGLGSGSDMMDCLPQG